jgi:type IV secretory pathway VirB2 component (pilin)
MGQILRAMAILFTAIPAYASNCENVVEVLRAAFTGPIARGLSLVAIVVVGIMLVYSRNLAGVKHRGHVSMGQILRAMAILFTAIPAYASPWENAVEVLRAAFTGSIARGLSLVAIVVGGIMFAFGEGDSKRMLAGIVFGVGMAIGAVNFMDWLFP